MTGGTMGLRHSRHCLRQITEGIAASAPELAGTRCGQEEE